MFRALQEYICEARVRAEISAPFFASPSIPSGITSRCICIKHPPCNLPYRETAQHAPITPHRSKRVMAHQYPRRANLSCTIASTCHWAVEGTRAKKTAASDLRDLLSRRLDEYCFFIVGMPVCTVVAGTLQICAII